MTKSRRLKPALQKAAMSLSKAKAAGPRKDKKKEQDKSRKTQDKTKKAAQKAEEAKENARIRKSMNDLRKQDEDSESEDNEGLEGVRQKKRVVADIDSDEDGDQDQVAVHGEDNRSEDDEISSQGDQNIDALQLDCEKVSDVGSDEEPDGLFGKDILAEADEKLVVEEDDVRPSKRSRLSNSKTNTADFSPRSLRLAKAGRTAVRVFIATSEEHGGFPHHHIELTWEALERLAKEPWAEKDWEQVVAEARKNNIRKRKLTGYGWTGAAQIRGELKRRVVSTLSAHYGIPAASKAETKDLVNWLLEKGHFKYGGLDTQKRTFDRNQPLGHPIVLDVILQQWFSTGKSEGVSLHTASSFKDIPLPIIVLVLTAVENALLEYQQDGSRLNIQFSMDSMGARYNHHMRCATELRTKSPNWFSTFQKSLYESILEKTNYVHILAKEDEGKVQDELDELNFEDLEKSVKAT